MDQQKILDLARQVLSIEADAIQRLMPRLGEDFVKACQICLGCSGRIVVTGMGKSGHIGSKLAATLASTGSPSFFVHSGEASHGDLGMITGSDILLAISNSGETSEIVSILPLIKRLGIPLITLTGNPNATLSKAATVNLDVSVDNEACPLNLAPTASTTATLAMGDALSIVMLELRGFTQEDFARSHPGGSLGRRLLLHVDDVMRKGDAVPRVKRNTPLSDALLEMSRKGLGMTAVVNQDDVAVGIFTDGDLRRALDSHVDVHTTTIDVLMTEGCKTVKANKLAAEAVRLMDQHRITSLLVIDDDAKLVGALNVHDLLHAGVM